MRSAGASFCIPCWNLTEGEGCVSKCVFSGPQGSERLKLGLFPLAASHLMCLSYGEFCRPVAGGGWSTVAHCRRSSKANIQL